MTEITPCHSHRVALIGPHAVDWNRALEIATACDRCTVTA